MVNPVNAGQVGPAWWRSARLEIDDKRHLLSPFPHIKALPV